MMLSVRSAKIPSGALAVNWYTSAMNKEKITTAATNRTTYHGAWDFIVRL